VNLVDVSEDFGRDLSDQLRLCEQSLLAHHHSFFAAVLLTLVDQPLRRALDVFFVQGERLTALVIVEEPVEAFVEFLDLHRALAAHLCARRTEFLSHRVRHVELLQIELHYLHHVFAWAGVSHLLAFKVLLHALLDPNDLLL